LQEKNILFLFQQCAQIVENFKDLLGEMRVGFLKEKMIILEKL
jgi:hypothetical protein